MRKEWMITEDCLVDTLRGMFDIKPFENLKGQFRYFSRSFFI